MAFANRNNHGVFIPYHQLIDLRSLNPPVTFIPGDGPVGPPQLVPFGFALSQEILIQIEEARSRALLQFMAVEGLLLSPEDEIKWENAIDKLKQIVVVWIRRVACNRGLERHITAPSAAILVFGSYGLGEDFFIVLHNMLTSRPEVSEVHCIKDAKVPLIRFKLDGISMDMLYARLEVMSVPEASLRSIPCSRSKTNVDMLNPYFLKNIDETSRRSLSGVHLNNFILRLIPNIVVFQSLLRCIKLWAKRRGVYGNLLGFFGGVHLAILVAFICQRYPNARLSGVISSFFGTFAFWDWPKPVILQDEMLPISGRAAEPQSLMPISWEREYCHSNITKRTFYRIQTEFFRGHTLTKDLLIPDFDWGCLFEPFPYTKMYTQFVKIHLSASDQDELGEWVGWVKSRFPSLLVKLEKIQGFYDPNPTEYVDVNVAEANIVFYWGLQPEGSDFLDIDRIMDEFVMSFSNGYQGPTRKIMLSVVEAFSDT